MDGYWERVGERKADDSPLPRRLRPDHLRRRHRRRGRAALRRAHPVLLQPLPARVPRLRRPARLPHHQHHQDRLAEPDSRSRRRRQLTWKDLVDGGHVIAGSPATVRERMEDMIKKLRVGHVFCLLHTGNQPDDKSMYSTKLFAEKVMPHLRDMLPEHADDNRFWAKPLARQARPQPLPGSFQTKPLPQYMPEQVSAK